MPITLTGGEARVQSKLPWSSAISERLQSLFINDSAKHLLMGWVNALFKTKFRSSFFQTKVLFCVVFLHLHPTSPSPKCMPKETMQWTRAVRRYSKNIHLIMPIKLLNISTQNGLLSTSLACIHHHFNREVSYCP